VSEVARLAGVSIRTLHHYDEIGLVRPSARSTAGYRLYAQKDLERLQQVLFFKEFEFPLDEIQRIIGSPNFDLGAAVRMQRQLLTERAIRIKALIAAVDAAIHSIKKGTTMTNEERFEVFGDFDPLKYEDEVKEKWGNSEAYRESVKRTKHYTKDDWIKIKAEADGIFEELAKLFKRGHSAHSPEAMDLAERHRKHIARWFYPCSHSFHRGLGELYVNDSHFSAYFERYAHGLTSYARDAWVSNAERHQ
jgi:MerR family transcriptional regulator, thiopeptide resistance regulator